MEEGSSPEFWQLMGLYEVPMFISLLGFGIGILFPNFHVCRKMLLFSAMLYMLVRYVNPKGPMCFMYLMVILSGHNYRVAFAVLL